MVFAAPASRRTFLRFVADHNPFYLLSATSMLLACLLLSNTMTWSPIRLNRLLGLIVTLNIYEVMLVGLALYLIAKRGIWRDGIMLLVLEALFVVDVGFLNSEVFQQNLGIGWAVNVGLFLLALVKLGAIFAVLRLPLRSPGFGLLALEMAALFVGPGVLKWMSNGHHGNLPPLALYAGWWIAAMLMAGYAVVGKFTTTATGDASAAGGTARPRGVAHVFLLLPLASLVAHLGTQHWVYESAYSAADFSPVLLGLPMLLSVVPPTPFAGRRELTVTALLMIVMALVTSASDNNRLDFEVATLSFTPFALGAGAAYLVFAYTFFRRQFAWFVIAGAAAIAVRVAYALLGPPIEAAGRAIARAYRWLADCAQALVPTTQGAWGIIALVGAFVLLGFGAVVSLLKGKDEPGDEPAAAEPQPVVE